MQGYEVNFFRKEDGSCPVEEFFSSLDAKMRAKLLMAVALLEDNGPQLREPYSKPLDDGIFEIRAQHHQSFVFLLCGKTNYINKWFCEKNAKNTGCGDCQS